MSRRLCAVGWALAVVIAAALASVPPAAAQTADSDLPVGHFFPQTGGSAGPQFGYRISDEAGIGFWSEFRRLGGIPVLGYPISRRFMLDGYMVQATQKVLLQWRPDISPPRAVLVNVFDRLHDQGGDAALQLYFQVPPPFDQGLFDTGKSPGQAQADRLALLNGDPAIAGRYKPTDAVSLELFGLPTSTITNQGPFFAIRTQRAVLQHWIADNSPAGVRRGDVTVVNGGDIAKALGFVPADAGLPETITGLVAQGAAPAPAPVPASAPAPVIVAAPPAPAPPAPPTAPQAAATATAAQWPWVWKTVSTPPTDCGPTQKTFGWLAPHQFSCDDNAPNGGTQVIEGHVLDQNGVGLAGMIVRMTAYGLNYDTGSDQDGTFGFILSNSCPIENRVYTLYIVDGQGRQSSNVYTVNYSNCNVAGEFHVDFIKTGP